MGSLVFILLIALALISLADIQAKVYLFINNWYDINNLHF